MVRMKYCVWAVVALLMLTTGCAPLVVPVSDSQPSTTAPVSTPTTAPKPTEPVIVPSPRDTAVRPNSAVAKLLKDAWYYNEQGEYGRSNAVVERALRINHEEPEIYLVMASNYFAMAKLQLAEQLARQGIPFATGNAGVKRELQQLLNKVLAAQ